MHALGAPNFTLEELKNAIEYAHIRNVKVHLALNILIKNEEFLDALSVAEKAYEYGVDAIIVQDLGLATTLIEHFPNLDIHASTQMTTNNLNGVKTLENLGFKRAVLSRELSLQEIEYICRNTNMEIETFIHGALCISYSGQCLLSSMIGGRSANRGKCAQACRLPYDLLQDDKVIDSGYLLSPRDLCGLELIPSLIDAGVTSFKIEGRLKSPEYVAIVTKVYRKYIDMYYSSKKFEIDQKDMDELRQVFNRGNFSTGHLNIEPNRNLVYKEKQNNMGIYIGNVANYNDSKGHITLNLNEAVALRRFYNF
ncbi:MAG: U32 family peptidase [Clostridia bacterium]|nr:U32 family peptidase [Clostridia bacterium]